MAMLHDCEPFEVVANGQRCQVAFHPAHARPDGRNHGAAGICVAGGNVVLISQDGVRWDFPAGRPEGHETLEQTLRREVLEEACATVLNARLLGFSRGECIEGHEQGLVLVRSLWLASVNLHEWKPTFEIGWRRTVPAADALANICPEYHPLWVRVFALAGLP